VRHAAAADADVWLEEDAARRVMRRAAMRN
jgi:hypothetical protein